MFSAKNYGLPKDLIEAAKRVHEKQLEEGAHDKMPSKEHVMKMLKDGMSETEMMKMHSDVDKDELKKLVKDCKQEMKEERSTAKRVHEKQLMEYDEDGYINNPPEGMDKGTPEKRKKAYELGLEGPHLERKGRVTKKQKQNIPPLPEKNPIRKPKTEEVQFTEEELAEAFAIFLEENFHVDMLTEEDLDYVFENEFPQWLEEETPTRIQKRGELLSAKQIQSKGRAYRKNQREFNDVTPPSTSPLNDVTPQSKTGSGPDRSMEGIGFQRSKTPPTGSGPTAKKSARKQVRRSAPKPQSFGELLRKVGGNAPATSDTAAGRRKIALLDARAKARTAARDAMVRKTGRGLPRWAEKAFTPPN